jgi:hypothetical protein
MKILIGIIIIELLIMIIELGGIYENSKNKIQRRVNNEDYGQ